MSIVERSLTCKPSSADKNASACVIIDINTMITAMPRSASAAFVAFDNLFLAFCFLSSILTYLVLTARKLFKSTVFRTKTYDFIFFYWFFSFSSSFFVTDKK